MKPAALSPAIGLRTICGIFVASALALTPGSSFAQRGAAGAHAGMGRPGGVRAPVVRAPQAPVMRAPAGGVSRPTAASPVITRPIITRPAGVSPLAPFHTPGAAFPAPLMSGMRFPSRPPLRFPVRPIGSFLGTAGFFGLGYNPFWFPGCNPFLGFAYGCGMLSPYSPYFGIGYGPVLTYPSGPVYPSEPDYPPVDSSASLQYTPLLNQYPAAESLPAEDLGAPSSISAQLRNDFLLYLKDGSVFAVARYTVSDGYLHYATAYGEKNDVAVDLLDLQKTIEANAARGVSFTLTPPSPAPGASAPALLGPMPAPPGPITPPKQ